MLKLRQSLSATPSKNPVEKVILFLNSDLLFSPKYEINISEITKPERSERHCVH